MVSSFIAVRFANCKNRFHFTDLFHSFVFQETEIQKSNKQLEDVLQQLTQVNAEIKELEQSTVPDPEKLSKLKDEKKQLMDAANLIRKKKILLLQLQASTGKYII